MVRLILFVILILISVFIWKDLEDDDDLINKKIKKRYSEKEKLDAFKKEIEKIKNKRK